MSITKSRGAAPWNFLSAPEIEIAHFNRDRCSPQKFHCKNLKLGLKFSVCARGVARHLFLGYIFFFWGGRVWNCWIAVLTSFLPHKKVYLEWFWGYKYPYTHVATSLGVRPYNFGLVGVSPQNFSRRVANFGAISDNFRLSNNSGTDRHTRGVQ